MGFSVVRKEIGHIRKGENYTSISSFSHCFLKTSNTWKGEPKSEGYCTLTLTHQLDLVSRCFQMFPAVQHKDCHGKNRLAMPQFQFSGVSRSRQAGFPPVSTETPQRSKVPQLGGEIPGCSVVTRKPSTSLSSG